MNRRSPTPKPCPPTPQPPVTQRRRPHANALPHPAVVVIRVGPKQAGFTLQDLLAEHLRLSRNKAKALLDQRRVFVNGVRVWMAHHVLRPGDQIEAPGVESFTSPPPCMACASRR